MNLYSEFFRFDSHAHFVAFINHIAALLEKRDDTINLPRLAKELKKSGLISTQDTADVHALLGQAAPFACKAAILRNNLFAHRSAALSYPEAFNKAAATPNEWRDLAETALKVVNRLLTARGLQEHDFDTDPLTDVEAMMKALSQFPPAS